MSTADDFDKWAESYDADIPNLAHGYPFDGYYHLLDYVRKQIGAPERMAILDIGIGTGLLSYPLYLQGADIDGVDFSNKMLSLAHAKMPKAHLVQCNFEQGIPYEFKTKRYDYIISSYAFHHLGHDAQNRFIIDLTSRLKERGKIFIADIAFASTEAMLKCKKQYQQIWDESEYYMIGAKTVDYLREKKITADFFQLSMCSGVLTVKCGE